MTSPPHNEVRPPTSPSVQDEDILWTEYLRLASDVDARLVKDWTKVIDVLLVFVALFSGVLTAFIIQTSDNFQPKPAEVTNKILIAIYNRTMNASTPIDLEQFLRLDDSSSNTYQFQKSVLNISLTISILVAALAMAAKLWIVRYSREVTTSGIPRVCAKKRQEAYAGLVAWKMELFINALPIMALSSVMLFALYIHSSNTVGQKYISVEQKYIGFCVDIILLIGISFVLVASFSAAFVSDSPFRSPFSDFINCVFRIFSNKPIPTFIPHQPVVLWRTITIIFMAILMLAAGCYFVLNQNYAYFVFVFYAIASVFALMRKGIETDMRRRRFSLPQWVLFSSVIVFCGFTASGIFSHIHLTDFSTLSFVLASIMLGIMGYIGIKMSETRPPRIAEAEAISWLLRKSSNNDPAWFEKAVQIAGQSASARAVLFQKLLPLLLPLIVTLPNDGHGGVTDEQKGYINILAILMDFAPQKKSLWCKEEIPTLPKELVVRLEELRASEEKCSHREDSKQEKWSDGTLGCPKACVSNAVEHILQLHESNTKKDKKQEKLSDETV